MHASQPPEEHDPKKCPDSTTGGHKTVLLQGNNRNDRRIMIQHIYPINIQKYAPNKSKQDSHKMSQYVRDALCLLRRFHCCSHSEACTNQAGTETSHCAWLKG
jgi:hypothetical protein